MKNHSFKTAFALSALISILASIASIGGLALPGLYRDSDFIKNAWLANDWVTLAVATPALIVAMRLALRNSWRAQLVWMGLLLYMLYNFAFYLFGAAFNEFFLLYVALFTLSMYALIFGLPRLDIPAISNSFSEKTPVRWIGVFLLFLALPLLFVEGGMCVRFIRTGEVPPTPSLIFALDMVFVIPGTILAAAWLWQHRPWGYVLAAMMLVKGATYGLVLSAAALLLVLKNAPEQDALLPFYLFVFVGSTIACTVLLRHLKQPSKS